MIWLYDGSWGEYWALRRRICRAQTLGVRMFTNFSLVCQMTEHSLGKRGTNGCGRYEHSLNSFAIRRSNDPTLIRCSEG